MDELIRIIISIAVAAVTAGLTALLKFIKSKLSANMCAKVEEIAAVVEQLYSGFTSTEKLTAFKEICSTKGINVNKAVEYLEQHIIPLSKKN